MADPNWAEILTGLGERLIARWEMWKPSIDMMGDNVYPMFGALVERMRAASASGPA